VQSKGQDIFRFKGIISMSGHDERFVVQGMHMLSDGKKGSSWADAERNSKMVFIGKGIKAADFEEGFTASQAKDSDKEKAE
jgi:G3E family GTPase